MKKVLFLFPFFASFICSGQSRAMENASELYPDGFTMVFYYSTLKMVLPEESVDLKTVIQGIEKIKILRISDENYDIGPEDGQRIVSDLRKDGYEEGLSMRIRGKNTLVYINEKRGTMKGIFIFFTEESAVTMVDLLGEVPIDKLFTLTKEIEALTANESIIDNIRDHQSN